MTCCEIGCLCRLEEEVLRADRKQVQFRRSFAKRNATDLRLDVAVDDVLGAQKSESVHWEVRDAVSSCSSAAF